MCGGVEEHVRVWRGGGACGYVEGRDGCVEGRDGCVEGRDGCVEGRDGCVEGRDGCVEWCVCGCKVRVAMSLMLPICEQTVKAGH